MHDHRKEDYLIEKIKPFDVKKVGNAEDILNALKDCGFQGRNLGKALDILYTMVTREECLTVMALSGAMVPAGMGDIICELIEHKLIDVMVTTGANVIHDLVDVFGNIGHYIGSPNVDDNELFKLRINRIYDTFLPEDNYKNAEDHMLDIIHKLFKDKNVHIKPSELFKKIGGKITKRCILSSAAKHNIPIFVPAFTDSEFALNLIKFSVREGYNFQFDILGDVLKFGEIIKESKECGTLIIGGGTPRNWSQQIFPLLDQIGGIETMGYNYSVRIHTATEYDGGLSGSTINEAVSWGKYQKDAKIVSIWCDSTIALPILITGLFQRLKII